MLGIIMAGGSGERLRPLTCTCPKPMLPLLDRPLLYYAFDLLKKHGVTKSAVTLGYLPDPIMDEFGDGSEIGMELSYFIEKEPLGTAGGVKQANQFLNETFCVLSGDGITDIDLGEAYRFHKSNSALATMVLTRVPNPTEYGLVEIDDKGRVLSFSEKPSWGSVVSDTVNTGIYILEPEALDRVPNHSPFDFGKDLFPLLLREGEPVYGYVSDAYWCDIGDIEAYQKAHEDALSGRISSIEIPQDGIIRMNGVFIDERAQISGPVFIGRGARIEKDTFISPYCVIGRNAFIEEGATVKRSILFDGAHVKKGAQIRKCILSARAIVSEGGSAYEGAVIGEKSEIGKRSCVQQGVRIWPGKSIPDATCINDNIVWGTRNHRSFDGGTIRAETPEEAARAGRAIAWKMELKTALVGKSASSVSASQALALSSGLAAGGVQVYETGECTLPQLRHALSQFSLDAAIYALGDSVTPIRRDQTYLTVSEKRALEAALCRQDMPRPYSGITKHVQRAGRLDLSYLAYLKSAAFGSIRRIHAAVFAQREQLLYLADHAFRDCGFIARVEWEEEMMELGSHEVGIYLSSDGESCLFADENGRLDDQENEMLISWAISESGEKTIYAPPAATRSLDVLANNMDICVKYAASSKDTWARELRKKSPFQFSMRTDGLFLALNILSNLNEKELSLSDFRKRMPHIIRLKQEIPIDFKKRGRAMRRMRTYTPQDYERDEWFFKGKNGCAWIALDDEKPLCTVTAESYKQEFASEICDLFTNMVIEASNDE